MRVETLKPGEADMAAPGRFNLRDLKKVARLARRLGLEAAARAFRSRVSAIRRGMPDAAEIERSTDVNLFLDGSEWDGDGDNCAHLFLDLIDAAGFDAALRSCLRHEGKGYVVELLDDDGDAIDVLACCHGETRTLAAAGMCLWVERITRRGNRRARL